MSYVAGVFLMYMNETDAFWCFVSVLERPKYLRGYFMDHMARYWRKLTLLSGLHSLEPGDQYKWWGAYLNTSRPRQNCRHFADDIFKCIFLSENAWVLLKILLKFVPKVRFNNIPALVHIMAWRGLGDKPLSEPMMVIGIDTKIEVIVVSPTTWEAHHSPQASPSGCGELPRSLVTPQWPKSRYQFLFYHDASKHIKSMYIRVCISRKSLIKLLQISHYGKHGHRPLSQQLLSYVLVTIVMSQWCPCH